MAAPAANSTCTSNGGLSLLRFIDGNQGRASSLPQGKAFARATLIAEAEQHLGRTKRFDQTARFRAKYERIRHRRFRQKGGS
eukprot:3521337-Pleurochrysis_carterae.AAC.1